MSPLQKRAFVPSIALSPRKTAPASKCIFRNHSMSHRPRWSATIILAPGQGAQAVDMGKTWRERSKAAASVFESANEILGTTLGAPLTDLIFSSNQDASDTLSRTDVAQPAIFVTSMACWAGMKDLGLVDASSLSATAGLSLGEYTALTIAGAIKFEDALRLVTLRGRAMQDAAETSDGGMVALIGASDNDAQEIVDECRADSVLVAANFNAPGQVVLSGNSDAIDRAAKFAAEERKLRVAKLDVAGAFHSPLMAPAAERLEKALQETDVTVPTVPVLSNVTGRPHESGSIRQLLVQQLTNPVRWAKCCEFIKSAEQFSGAEWVELAPGKTLSGIMRKIDRKISVTNRSDAPVGASV